MHVQKLERTDGFILFDLDDAPAVGVVRLARKVLRDSAEMLARSTTYAAALFGVRAGGASAGINALPDQRADALAAFVDEVGELVASGRWLPGPGLGLAPDDLAALPKAEERGQAFDPALAAAGAVAVADGITGGLGDRRVGLVGEGAVVDAAARTLRDAGVEPTVGVAPDADVEVLLVAGKPGTVDDEVAATVRATHVVPLSPVPVTTKALAVLGRAGRILVPDFLSTAAPLLAAVDGGGGVPLERVHEAARSLAGAGTDTWMAAVERAESHLATWREELPFGRPLA